MKRYNIVLAAIALGLSATGLRAEDAAPAWGKAADNKIFAQTITNDLMAKNPDLKVLGIHVIAPGAKKQTMVATNLDRVGKDDDDDDVAVATQRQTIIGPNLKDDTKFEVLLPLKTVSGKVIGALGLVFSYKAGDDEVKMLGKGVAIRDGVAKQVTDLADLFKPAK